MISLDFYLTSLEPDLNQTILSQSIGGYCSNSVLYSQSYLASNVGLYDTSFVIDEPSNGYSVWQNYSYLSINGELIKISSISNSGLVLVEERGSNGNIAMHLSGDKVIGISCELFNDVFNTSNIQYRCLAVKNTTTNGNPSNYLSLENIAVFIKQNSRNSGVNIELSVELPKSQYMNGISTNRTRLTLTDSSLAGLYEDNHFSECFVKPHGESGGIVRSYDSDTGTFTFYSSFSEVIINKSYEIFPAPCQRLKSGIDEPVINNNMSQFFSYSKQSPLYLDSIASLSGGVVLNPNDIFYIWIKRTINKGTSEMSLDDFVIDILFNSTV